MVNINIENELVDSLRKYVNSSPIYEGLRQTKSDSAFINLFLKDVIKFDRLSEMVKGQNVPSS